MNCGRILILNENLMSKSLNRGLNVANYNNVTCVILLIQDDLEDNDEKAWPSLSPLLSSNSKRTS
jgi:hypothetical protein